MKRAGLALIVAGIPVVALSAPPHTQKVEVTNPTLSVDVANPTLAVEVVNSVPVQIEEVTKDPFSRWVQLVMNDGEPNATPDLYTVAEGKQLVVTYVSAAVSIPSGQSVAFRVNTVSNNFLIAIHDLPTSPSGPLVIGGSNSIVTSAPVNFIVEAGQTLSCWALRSSTTGTSSGRCGISGYLLDVPE